MVRKVGLKTGNKRAIYIIVSEGEEDSTVVREIRPDESWMTDIFPRYASMRALYEHITTSLVNFKNFSRTEIFEIRYPLVYCAVMARE